ncbi:MAG: lysozyme inhibitor LprI family protein [Streptosporangiaceae bacterium]
MGQQRGGTPVTSGSVAARGARLAGTAIGVAVIGVAARGARLAGAAIGVAVIGALAGCGGSAGSASGSSTPAAQATASTARAAAAATASGAGTATASAAAAFTPIVEPFDPGHPATSKPAPATCGGQSSTLAIEQCYEARTENADAAIDAVQLARYQSGSQAQRAAIAAGDSAWLSARQPVCAKAFHSGGTIDGIGTAGCLLSESTARLDALKGMAPPEAALKSTDNTDPSALSWYTTPEGSRIAMTDTQGDSTGGVIIAWVVIGGADGFLVNPAQFSYVDGSFTDQGKVQAPNPAGHRVSPGAEYQFDIDYSRLSADPHAGRDTGGWVYAPGTPVADWR